MPLKILSCRPQSVLGAFATRIGAISAARTDAEVLASLNQVDLRKDKTMRHCTPAQTLESFKGVPILVVDKLRLRWTLLAMFICMTVMPLIAAGEADSTAIGTQTVEGLVRDIACPLQNKKSTSTSFSKDCITMCLKSGSPLGILTSDGDVYVPVTQSMPDMGQNALKPFVGEHVKATGRVFLRNGTHAIEIGKIDRLPDAAQGK